MEQTIYKFNSRISKLFIIYTICLLFNVQFVYGQGGVAKPPTSSSTTSSSPKTTNKDIEKSSTIEKDVSKQEKKIPNKPRYGIFNISTIPAVPGVKVLLNDNDIGTTNKKGQLKSPKKVFAQYTIKVQHDYYKADSQKKILNENIEDIPIVLSLKQGSLSIYSNPAVPKAKVYLNSKEIGETNDEGNLNSKKIIDIGEKILRIEHPDYETYEREVTIKEENLNPIQVSLKPKFGTLVLSFTDQIKIDNDLQIRVTNNSIPPRRAGA